MNKRQKKFLILTLLILIPILIFALISIIDTRESARCRQFEPNIDNGWNYDTTQCIEAGCKVYSRGEWVCIPKYRLNKK